MRSFLFLLIGFLLTASSAAVAADAERSRQELERLRGRIEALRTQMQSKSGEKDQLSLRLQEAEKLIGRLASRLRALDGRLVRQRDRLSQLQQERTDQVLTLSRHREALARQVRAAYAMGRQERLKILLNQQDPATVSRVMVYYDYLSKARAEKMQLIRQHMQRLSDTQREIVDEERQLAELHAQQESELSGLRRSQSQRRELVERLTRELNDQGRQLDRLRSNERDLETLIGGLEEALSDIPLSHPQQQAFAGLRGRLPWPASGRMVSRFGTPKLGSLVWDGVMISAPEGREVRAIHHGRVAFADWLRGFGLLLIVDHGDGYMTLYGHNQSLFKEVGDWVDAGDPVASVGNSGGREQAGIYFGIRYQGRAVDPAKWCRRPSGSKVG